MYECTCVYMHNCIYTCMYACLFVSECVCMYTVIYACICMVHVYVEEEIFTLNILTMTTSTV